MDEEAQRELAFNRLYERLVVRGAQKKSIGKKKKKKTLAKPPHGQSEATQDPKLVHCPPTSPIDTHPKNPDTEKDKEEKIVELQREQQYCMDHVVRLRMRRNYRLFARIFSRSHQSIAAAIAQSSSDVPILVEKLVKLRQQHRCYRRRKSVTIRAITLESIVAKLYQCSIAASTVSSAKDASMRILDDLCFFSPPPFQSMISYSSGTNAVPVPPMHSFDISSAR